MRVFLLFAILFLISGCGDATSARSVPRWKYPLIEIQVSSPNTSPLSKNHPILHSKTITSTPKTSSPHQNPSSNPPPLLPQHIKLESKHPFANGKTRISPHTFSWQRPGKSPSAALFPADLLDFHPLDRYFGWKNPLKSPMQMCIYISICVEKKDWERKSPSVSK